jgi:Ca2+-binding RTX toxin-like protein
MIVASPWFSPAHGAEQIGADNNNAENPFLQPEDPALSGGGRDQTLENGDILIGTRRADVQIGLLGIDTMLGRAGNDVQVGGRIPVRPMPTGPSAAPAPTPSSGSRATARTSSTAARRPMRWCSATS